MFTLTDNVTELCRFLNAHVLSETNTEITVLDLLDALAACDLVLEDDEKACACDAYMELIKAGSSDAGSHA
jgi:hypothetical protein